MKGLLTLLQTYVILGCFLNQTYSFKNIGNIINSPLLHL